jgi:hypothetical protein
LVAHPGDGVRHGVSFEARKLAASIAWTASAIVICTPRTSLNVPVRRRSV